MSCDNHMLFVRMDSGAIDVVDVGESAGSQGHIRQNRNGEYYFDAIGYPGILCVDQMAKVLEFMQALTLVNQTIPINLRLKQ